VVLTISHARNTGLDDDALAAIRAELTVARNTITRIETILEVGAPRAEQTPTSGGVFEISPLEKFEKFEYRGRTAP
jgi:hypothetical protein